MAIDDNIVLFEQAPILRLLGRTALRILALGARSHQVPQDGLLFAKGDVADCGYLIQQGSLLVSGEAGQRAEIAGPGSLLGEFSMIAEGVRPASATAREDSTVITIPRSLFVRTLDSYPDAAIRLRDHIGAQVGQSGRDLARVRAALSQPGQR